MLLGTFVCLLGCIHGFFLVICSGIELQGCRHAGHRAIYSTNLPFLRVSNGYSKSSNVVSASTARQALSHRNCLIACTLPTNPGKEGGALRDSPTHRLMQLSQCTLGLVLPPASPHTFTTLSDWHLQGFVW